MKLLLVRYSIACLRLFVVILQDLHSLQRFFYHSVDHWGIKLYPSHQFPQVAYLWLVRYRNACLRLIVVILQDLHCLQRFYHNLIIGVLYFTILSIFTFSEAFVVILLSIFTFSEAFVSEIQKCLPEAICCYITRFTLFTEILSQLLSLVYYTLPSYQFSQLVERFLVIYRNACLSLFVVVIQDLHCLQIFYRNIDHWGIELYHHTKCHI